MTRIAVLVSGGGTNLQALLDAQEKDQLGSGKITLVISSKAGVYALERAKNHGVQAIVIPAKGVSQSDYDAQIAAALAEHKIDLVVLAGFLRVLGSAVLNQYKQRIINVHPSLIPSFCGAGCYGLKVHEQALAYGVKITGATVHFVSDVVDGGEILLQKAVQVLPNDTPQTLQQRVMQQAEWVILPQAVRMIVAGK